MKMTILWVAMLLIYGVSAGNSMKSGKAGTSNVKPGSSNNRPGSPGSSNNQPGSSNNQPGSSNNQPGSSNNQPGSSNNQPSASNNAELPLDMAPNSVDDMYSGCRDKMMKDMPTYLENEKNKNPQFKEAWENAERIYKWKKPPAVGREQTLAIYVYTFISGNMYRYFNDAVRSQRSQYTTTFGYHALHFLLTDAIQSLNKRRLEQLAEGEERCLTVFRRVNEYFRRDVVNTQIRFGSFTSTSRGRYPSANVFGTKSCFEIVTCMGGDFSLHSKYKNEGEVVIPPYEIFKVVEVLQKSAKQPNLDCDVVYKLQSTEEADSKLNCALFKN